MPADHPESPFSELDMYEIAEGMGRVRTRQHVNPLIKAHQLQAPPLDGAAVFDDPSRPLVVDLGCGPGRFLLLMAHRQLQQQQRQQQQQQQQHLQQDTQPPAAAAQEARAQQEPPAESTAGHQQAAAADASPATSTPSADAGQLLNFLGIELRKPIVERAQMWADRLGVGRSSHFLYTNATVSLAGLLAGYPGGVDTVCVQFPDPHFKRRNHKKRIFQPQLVHAIVGLLPPGGHVFLQSDVEEVAIAMRAAFEAHASDTLRPSPQHHDASPDHVFFSEPPLPAAAAPAAADSNTSSSQGAPPQPANTQPGASAASAAGTPEASHASDPASASSSAAGVEPHGAAPAGSTSSGGGAGSSGPPDEDGEHGAGEDEDGGPSGDGGDGGSAADFDSVWEKAGWLRVNPLGVPTEREHYVMQMGQPVYRVLLERC